MLNYNNDPFLCSVGVAQIGVLGVYYYRRRQRIDHPKKSCVIMYTSEKKINSNGQQFHKYLHKPPSLTSNHLTHEHIKTATSQALVARTTPFFLTFCLQIYFQSNFFISLLFHLFFLILTCSCQYSYNLMLTSNCMCRPYTDQWTSETCYQLQ